MLSRKTTFISAAAIAVALLVTVAIARTVHTHGTATGAQPVHHSAIGAASGSTAHSPLRGSIACGAMSYSDCEQIEQLSPM